MNRGTTVALALIASAATALTAALAASSDVLATPTASAVVRAATVAAWALCGLRTWERRPDSRLGALMVAAAVIYALAALNALGGDVVFTLASLLWAGVAFSVCYVALVFPSGLPPDQRSRLAVSVLAAATVVLWTGVLLSAPTFPTPAEPFHCASDCPANPFAVLDLSAGAAKAIERAAVGLFGVAGLLLIAFLALRMRAATAAERRGLLPPTLALCSLAGGFVIALVLSRGVGADRLTGVAGWLTPVCGIGFPLALLLGQGQSRLFAAASLRDVVGRLSPGPAPRNLETLMADALGDPTLQLAFPVGGRGFVDGAGADVALPAAGATARAVAEVRDERELMAVIVHDPALEATWPGVVEAAAGAILLALENARLEAELRAAARALEASRTRLLTAAVGERRRLERDLHDTAQQRLVALRIKLALAQERSAADGLEPLLERLGDDVEATIDSVRVVGRGLYPPLLADRGLGAALTSALARETAQLSLSVGALGRSAPEVEAAVYLCCRALVDLFGEQDAARGTLSLALEGERLRIVVVCAGADGEGLRERVLTQTRDHVVALGGWARESAGAGPEAAGSAGRRAHETAAPAGAGPEAAGNGGRCGRAMAGEDADGAWRLSAVVPWPPRATAAGAAPPPV